MTKDTYTFVTLEQKRFIQFPFQLLQTGICTIHPQRYAIPNHGHLEFCLRLNSTEEYAEDMLDGVEYRYTFPHLFIKRPNVYHHYEVRGIRKALYMIYPTATLQHFAGLNMLPEQPGIEFSLSENLEQLIQQYISLLPLSCGNESADRFDMLALSILHEILLQKYDREFSSGDGENIMYEINSFIQINFKEPDILEKAVSKSGYSYRTFLRRWKELFKGTPAAFIEKLRMDEAVRLLQNHNFMIKEISSMTGFAYPGNFIQAFKRRFRASPDAWRKQNKSGKNTLFLNTHDKSPVQN